MEKQQNNYCVYKHTTPNGKVYIGITSKKPEARWNNGKGYWQNKHFTQAIEKYGWQNIQHEILLNNLTKQEACEAEIRLIAEYDSTNPNKGYNNSTGGEGGSAGIKYSEERRAKISGKGNPNFGKKWTAEQLQVRQSHRVYKYGAENPSSKPILQLTLDGEIVKRWVSIREASKEFCITSIKDCLRGKYKKHRGYRWEYEAEYEKRNKSI